MSEIKVYINEVDINNLISRINALINALEKEAKGESSTISSEKFLTRGEVAGLLRITLPTLHDWTKKGLLKAYRISNRIRYKETEVIAVINNSAKRTTK